jgi:hypothetical protein
MEAWHPDVDYPMGMGFDFSARRQYLNNMIGVILW